MSEETIMIVNHKLRHSIKNDITQKALINLYNLKGIPTADVFDKLFDALNLQKINYHSVSFSGLKQILKENYVVVDDDFNDTPHYLMKKHVQYSDYAIVFPKLLSIPFHSAVGLADDLKFFHVMMEEKNESLLNGIVKAFEVSSPLMLDIYSHVMQSLIAYSSDESDWGRKTHETACKSLILSLASPNNTFKMFANYYMKNFDWYDFDMVSKELFDEAINFKINSNEDL